MKHFFLLLTILISSSFQLTAQQKLSHKATVSVITCGAGDELYSTFGHSAYRIYDPVLGIDKIYNYGTFDFNAPDFYFNFAKGKLTYLLSTTSFSRFLREYQYYNRWVKSQLLDLTDSQAQAVFVFLENNAKPENSSYQYDFFYDNCATKIEDVIKIVLKDTVTFNNDHITTHKTHRDLIKDYTKNQKWGKFGIDLALGSVIDIEAPKDDYKFLPDYIYEGFKNATIKNDGTSKPLVKREQVILTSRPQERNSLSFLTTPFAYLLFISLLIIFMTFKNYKLKYRNKLTDFSLYFVTGIIGIVVLLLWFATSHTATYKNFNFLWAFAPNALVAFYVLKEKLPIWLNYYNILLLILIGITFLIWMLRIQVFNNALIPFLIAIAIRYVFLIRLRH